MKPVLKSLIFALALFFSFYSSSQDDTDHLMCNDYWTTVDFNAFTLNLSHFDFEGENDICKADSNDSYPYDELIYITINNAFDEEGAKADYEDEKEYNATVDGFMEVPNLGDNAFAVLRVGFGKLNSVIIEVVKGIYTIHIEINGNTTTASNNLFTPTSVFDFARAMADRL